MRKTRCRRKARNPRRRRTSARHSSSPTRLLSQADGKKAAKRFGLFWKLKGVPSIRKLAGPNKVFVGMGRSPGITIADGPNKKSARRIKRTRHNMTLVTDSGGKKMWIVGRRGLPTKPKLKALGWTTMTEYIPPPDVEKAGSHKAHKHWQHDHGLDGGRWPKVSKDQNGNYWIHPAKFRVTKWIYK